MSVVLWKYPSQARANLDQKITENIRMGSFVKSAHAKWQAHVRSYSETKMYRFEIKPARTIFSISAKELNTCVITRSVQGQDKTA